MQELPVFLADFNFSHAVFDEIFRVERLPETNEISNARTIRFCLMIDHSKNYVETRAYFKASVDKCQWLRSIHAISFPTLEI